MDISGIPVAKNYISYPQSQLAQRVSGLSANQERISSSLDNIASQCHFTKSLVSSENGYTKKDAVMKQWNLEGSFNLYDVINGAKVPIQNPAPSDEVLAKFEQQLQANGISKELNWNKLNFDLKGIGFNVDDPAYAMQWDDFSKKVDYLASRYAAAENKLQSIQSAESRSEQLQKLQETYNTAADELASTYSNMIGSFLEKNGVHGEQESIYASVRMGVDSRAKTYRQILPESDTLLSLKGTADSWLLDDDEYVASVLRESKIDSAQSRAVQPDSKYTLRDLSVLGQYVSELASFEKAYNTNPSQMDEERIGLEFSMLAMKTDLLCKEGGISIALSKTLNSAMSGYMEAFLDRKDAQLSEARKKGGAVNDEAGFSALDRKAVWAVYNQTMQSYQAGGDAMQALNDGAKFAMELRNSKVTSQAAGAIYRYKNSDLYWSNFFTANTDSGRLGNYKSSGRPFQSYLSGWADFKDSLARGDKQVFLNLILKSAEEYLADGSRMLNRFV